MEEPRQSSPGDRGAPSGLWWLGWVVSIIMTPIAGMWCFSGNWQAVLLCAVGFLSHTIFSAAISGQHKSCFIPVLLFVGGWLAMFFILAVGCSSPYGR
jgi:hypothetical protein